MPRLPLDDGASYAEQSRLRWHLVNINDGIISAAGITEGMQAAGALTRGVVLAGLLVMLAGAAAIGAMKYSEAAAERDAQLAVMVAEGRRLEASPLEELAELTEIYQAKGLSPELAAQVAEELSARDALGAQLDAEYGLTADPAQAVPWVDAVWAAAGFVAGALVPLVIVAVTPSDTRFVITFGAVLVALAVSGALEARAGGGRPLRAMARLTLVGATTMTVTALAGLLVGDV